MSENADGRVRSRADVLIRRGVCGGRDRVRPGRTNGKRDAEMIPFPRESFRFTKRDLSGARARARGGECSGGGGLLQPVAGVGQRAA